MRYYVDNDDMSSLKQLIDFDWSFYSETNDLDPDLTF